VGVRVAVQQGQQQEGKVMCRCLGRSI
jgi:hypothetical protein